MQRINKRGMTMNNESHSNKWNPIATAILGTDDSAKNNLKKVIDELNMRKEKQNKEEELISLSKTLKKGGLNDTINIILQKNKAK